VNTHRVTCPWPWTCACRYADKSLVVSDVCAPGIREWTPWAMAPAVAPAAAAASVPVVCRSSRCLACTWLCSDVSAATTTVSFSSTRLMVTRAPFQMPSSTRTCLSASASRAEGRATGSKDSRNCCKLRLSPPEGAAPCAGAAGCRAACMAGLCGGSDGTGGATVALEFRAGCGCFWCCGVGNAGVAQGHCACDCARVRNAQA
jgi:hypothetical protein